MQGFWFSEGIRGWVVETLAHLARKANDVGVDSVMFALTAHQSAHDFKNVMFQTCLLARYFRSLRLTNLRLKSLYRLILRFGNQPLINYYRRTWLQNTH